ncbi:Oligosaccharyltransferase PglB [hydrothermal vent metagenome]|uniref:Oligosaccharyltransferase PglB n=1 Tax=hydrothermal vent metagenome TaxID=652676 RepID=A0A1W1BTB9_9ZZZZ
MIDRDNLSSRNIVILITIAYLFSYLVRMIWVWQMQGEEQYMWNGQLMISTGDGYYFASGAQKWLENTLQFNPRVPDIYYTATVTLSAFVAKYTPLSLDSVILYMPAVISSLVVIPIILIGRLFGMAIVGFFAALLGSIAWSYYNRTMVGYFDTDMFSAMAPMFILYFLLATIKTEKRVYALFSAFAFLIYPFLYDQGKTIVYAMGLLYMGYMLLFHRKDDFTYRSILLITVGLIDFSFWGQFVVIVALYVAMERGVVTVKQAIYGSIVLIPIFLYTGNVHGLIFGKIINYFERGTVDHGLRFLQVSQTIREAGLIPFDVMANRISGSVAGVLIAFIGYIVLVVRHKEFILALPLIAIGLFSLVGGLRFTVYAVPMAAISAIYLFHVLCEYLGDKRLYYPIMALLTAAMIYPNIIHILGYRVPTVMTKREVMILDKLKSLSTPKDYVVTWWDYGYPIWYFAEKNTLIDGGKHNNDNFIVSEIMLTDSPLEAARLSRLAVEEYVASDYKLITDILFKNNTPEQVDVDDYLYELKHGDVKLPKKTRDVYLYMPWNMVGILPTINLFRNLDLKTGKAKSRAFYYSTQNFKRVGDVIHMGQGISWHMREGILDIQGEKLEIGKEITVGYTKDGKLHRDQRVVHATGRYHIIYMGSYNNIMIVDDSYLNSLFIQMFVFENYDKNLFEPVVMDVMAKIYKVKI